MPTPTSPATSPSTSGTSVSVAATVLFNDTPVTINSQDITNLKKNGLVFSLTNPVSMGSFADLVDWMNKNLNLPVTSKEIEGDLGELPDVFATPLQGLFEANITLSTLNINTKTSVYQVAATITPQEAIPILGILDLQSIGIQVSSGATTPTSP
jgi:hypothetical protein